MYNVYTYRVLGYNEDRYMYIRIIMNIRSDSITHYVHTRCILTATRLVHLKILLF